VVPSTLSAVLVFLLLVAPGIAFELLRQRARPPRGDTVFVEISRVLLAGVVISGLVVVLLAITRSISPGWLVDVRSQLIQGASYTAGNLDVIGVTVAAQLVLSLLLAVIGNRVLTPHRGRVITADSSWHVILAHLAGRGLRPFLSVELKDGTLYTGYRAEYSTEVEPQKRDLVLSPPIKVRRPAASAATALPDDWQRLWIRGDEITTIAVSYVGSPTPPSDGPRRVRDFVSHQAVPLALSGIVLVLGALLVGG